MGCGSGKVVPPTSTTEPTSVSPEHTMLVIVADFEVEVMGETTTETRVHLYSLPDCKLKTELLLPVNPNNSTQRLAGDVSVAAHASEPWLFVSGGTYSDANSDEFSPHIWKINVIAHSSEEESIQKVANLPIAMDILATHVHRHGDVDFLYVVGRNEKVWRLNLTTAKWEEVTSPPYVIREVQALLSNGNDLLLIGPNFCLSYKEPGDGKDEVGWGLILEKNPRGLHTMLNNTIATFANETKQLVLYDVDEVGAELVEHRIDAKFFSITSQMCGVGAKELLFTGMPREEDVTTVWKIILDDSTPEVLGHLENCPSKHRAFLCYPEGR